MTSINELNFEYIDDKNFFVNFLSYGDLQKLEREYTDYFDFRDPTTKRREFNLLRKKLLPTLLKRDNNQCQLKFDCCDNKNLVIDHFIPLSSNKLNRKLRNMKNLNNKKPKAQSFGSNDPKNLLVACERCNSYKKHRFYNPITKEIV